LENEESDEDTYDDIKEHYPSSVSPKKMVIFHTLLTIVTTNR